MNVILIIASSGDASSRLLSSVFSSILIFIFLAFFLFSAMTSLTGAIRDISPRPGRSVSKISKLIITLPTLELTV